MWQASLSTSGCSDCKICLDASFGMCFTLGYLRENLFVLHLTSSISGPNAPGVIQKELDRRFCCCSILLPPFSPLIASFLLRRHAVESFLLTTSRKTDGNENQSTKGEEQRNEEESACTSCLISSFCCPCSLCQIEKELINRKQFLGSTCFNSEKVYEKILPPPTPVEMDEFASSS